MEGRNEASWPSEAQTIAEETHTYKQTVLWSGCPSQYQLLESNSLKPETYRLCGEIPSDSLTAVPHLPI